MKILFIGNSYQYASESGWNFSADGQFVAMAEATGHTIDYETCYIGGSTLGEHWQDTTDPNPREELSKGIYDLAIINGKFRLDPTFDTYADLFATLAKSKGTDVAFFSPWAQDHEISVSKGDTTTEVHDQYQAAAARNDVAYAATAEAYALAHAELSKLAGDDGQSAENKLTYDSVHPAKLGAYLAACVMYATVFGTQPPTTAQYLPAGISVADANLMRQVAWTITQSKGVMLKDVGDGAGGGGTGGDGDSGGDGDGDGGGGGGGGGSTTKDAAISGRYFADADGDGRYDSGEGVAGVEVMLWKEGTGVIARMLTGADGSYSFKDLGPGTYQVRFAAGDSADTLIIGEGTDVVRVWANGTGVTSTIDLDDGETVSGVDAGEEMEDDGGTGGGGGGGGGDPAPVVFVADPADYDTVLKGSGGSETVTGSTGDDYAQGAAGNDRMVGRDGDDYLDGGEGRDSSYGGEGADIILFDLDDAVSNGGAGVDTLLFRGKGVQDLSGASFGSIEVFDFVNGATDDATLSYRQLRQARDAELRIEADLNDTIRIDTGHDVTAIGSVTVDGEVYDRYRIGAEDWGVEFSIDADARLVVGSDTIV
jgi:hypothetical protein